MNDEIFSLESSDTSEGSWLAKAVWLFLRLALLAFSGITTMGFFYRYAGASFTWLTQEEAATATIAPLIAAVSGLILLDIGALTWGYIRAHHASTIPQMALAGAMGVADLVLSLLVTALFIVLTSGFDSGLGASGVLLINQIGLGVLVIAISGNFAASYIYSQIGRATKEAAQKRRLAATMQAGRFAADDATAKMIASRTLAAIKAGLPARADQEAAVRESRYMETTLGHAPAPSGVVSPATGASGSTMASPPPLQPQEGQRYARHYTDEEMRRKEEEWMEQGKRLRDLEVREARQAANGDGGGDDIGPPFREQYGQ